jgi:hypothetical protein
MKGAFRVAAVDRELSLRRLAVALAELVALGREAGLPPWISCICRSDLSMMMRSTAPVRGGGGRRGRIGL